MPRPPVLEVLDWTEVFAQIHPWDAWIARAESAEQAERMRRALTRQEFDAGHAETLARLSRPVHVVAFAEDWCGDVIRHVPVLEKMARENPMVRVRYCSRAEQPQAFGRFLTNGGEAIPKFVFLNEDFVECGNWGPMPDALREVISRGKACDDVAGARKLVSERYRQDPMRREVVAEMLHRIEVATAVRP